jgi:diguanylate cyclase (GGDEF)-like protein
MDQLLSTRFAIVDRLIVQLSSQGRVLGLIGCVCLALVGMEVWQLQRVHDSNIQQTEVMTSNTARSMAEQAETTLKTADTIVASLVEQVEAEGTGPEARARLFSLMTSLASALPAIHEMGITDSEGNAIVKSLVANPAGLNYAAREYFRFHATHPDRGPFIGAQIKSKIDGSTNITVTRRINRPDGSFAGVVVTSVSMNFFHRLFDEMQAKSGGTIALLADDDAMTILARSPPDPRAVGEFSPNSEPRAQMRAQRAGSVAYTSPIDGVRRYGSFQHLSQFALTTLVAQSEWDLQSGWRTELRWHAIILACVLVVVVVVGGRAVQANAMLNRLATQDGLTGLANRRCLDETIEREFRRAARSRQPLSIVMLDVDHFKNYNDCYGHPAGDACLRAVAQAIQGCLRRAGDLAGRYGGEEFIVVLPGSDAHRAHDFAETLRLAVHGLALPHRSSPHGIITFSAGVATCLPGRVPGERQILVANADAALYAAKARGRNTVAMYAPAKVAIDVAGTARAPERKAA